MNTNIIYFLTQIIVLAISLQASDVSAMKRAPEAEADTSPAPKLKTAKLGDISTITYAEFLSHLYNNKKILPLDYKKFLTKLIQTCFTIVNNRPLKARLRIVWPAAGVEAHIVQITVEPKKTSIALHIDLVDVEGKTNIQNFLTYEISSTPKNTFYVINMDESKLEHLKLAKHIHALLGEIFPLDLWNQKQSGSSHNFKKFVPTELNYVDMNDLKHIAIEHKDSSLIEKISWLNNARLLTPQAGDNSNIWIDVNDHVSFQVQVHAKKYKSNGLSESNFLEPHDFQEHLYYRISFYVNHNDEQGTHQKPSLVLQIPLDGGYGTPALPSEIIWIQKEEHISGTEVLSYAVALLKYLAPKQVFLDDDAKGASCCIVPLRILRAVQKKSTMYESSAGFQIFNGDFLSHEQVENSQSEELYRQSIDFLHSYPVKDLRKLIQEEKPKQDIQKILSWHERCTTLGSLMNALYDATNKSSYYVLSNYLFGNFEDITITDHNFISKLEILRNYVLFFRSFEQLQ